MNGALVIPNLMCINFYALKLNKNGPAFSWPVCSEMQNIGVTSGLPQRFKRLNTLEMG